MRLGYVLVWQCGTDMWDVVKSVEQEALVPHYRSQIFLGLRVTGTVMSSARKVEFYTVQS